MKQKVKHPLSISHYYLAHCLMILINFVAECHNIFSLMVKGNQEVAESENKVHSFTVTDPSVEKPDYLRTLCNQIANVVCRTDPVSP